MSNVYKRARKLSELEFYMKSLELRDLLTRYVLNEKNVPKRYRFIIAIPITDSLNRLFYAIINANQIYPYNEIDLALRKDYQRQALVEVSYLFYMLDYMLNLFPQNKSRIKRIAVLLYNVYTLLKGWKNSSKIYKRNQSIQNIDTKDDNDVTESIIEEFNKQMCEIEVENIEENSIIESNIEIAK